MKYLILALMAGLGCLNVYSQNSLFGTITEKDTQTPLFGATIYISDLKKGTTSDTSGNYVIANLPAGKYLAEVKYIGHAARVVHVNISGKTRLDLELSITATEVHEVVITGVSHATEVRMSPVPTAVVSKITMLENASTNLVEAISRQPGISQVATGQAISKPVIRGLGYNRVVTLNNGLRQEGQQWGDEHGIEIDEYSIDRTELIKGPGSLMYGSDAMAGVINFLAPNPTDEGKIIGNILSNYQSNNGLFGNSFMTAGHLRGWHWLARASKKDAAAYSNAYDGKVFNSGYKEWSYNATLGLNKKWGYSHLSFSSFNQTTGMVEGERDSSGKFTTLAKSGDSTATAQVTASALDSYSIAVPNQQIAHNRIALQNYIIIRSSRLSLNLAFQQNERKEFGDVLAPETAELYFLLHTFTYDLKYALPEYKGYETTIGANGMLQKNNNKGLEFLIPDYALSDHGIYIVSKKTYHKLNLSGGLRLDQRAFQSDALYLDGDGRPASLTDTTVLKKFTALNLKFSNIVGSIGATWNLKEDFLVKLNLARGFRAPNPSELASNGKHEGTLRYEYGNAALKPETSLQTDLGLSYTTKHVTVDVAGFLNNIQQYIYAERLQSVTGGDSIADQSEPTPSYKYQQGNAVLKGGEVSVDIHPHPLDWLHFENSFSYVQGVNQGKADSSKYLPFMPPARFLSELKANREKTGQSLKNTFFKIQYDHYFRQDQVLFENQTETPAQGYQLVHLGAGTDVALKKGKIRFSFYVAVNNVMDLSYQNHLSRIRYAAVNPATGRTGVFNMGRNISFKLNIPIGFK